MDIKQDVDGRSAPRATPSSIFDCIAARIARLLGGKKWLGRKWVGLGVRPMGLCEGRWQVNVSASNSNKVLDSNEPLQIETMILLGTRRHIFDTCGGRTQFEIRGNEMEELEMQKFFTIGAFSCSDGQKYLPIFGHFTIFHGHCPKLYLTPNKGRIKCPSSRRQDEG
uniref:HDC18204 n=1 Tax=Drosophila melanogaster TaxID=7227 RepID=Q6IIH8_DROME|nr:TPA_inf: HDC18204 [Drosophila melanogaster]